MSTDLELMEQHVEALFVHDRVGRTISVNEPNGKLAPRFFLGRTTTGNIIRFRDDVDAATISALARLAVAEPIVQGVGNLPACKTEYIDVLCAPEDTLRAGPAYHFPEFIVRSCAETTLITNENVALLRGGMDDWVPDVEREGPFVAVVKGGRAVSVCCSVRVTAAAHEAGVETLEAYRGNGYAVLAVGSWAQRVFRSGAAPLYSTLWTNLASRALATKLGLRMYGVDFQIP